MAAAAPAATITPAAGNVRLAAGPGLNGGERLLYAHISTGMGFGNVMVWYTSTGLLPEPTHPSTHTEPVNCRYYDMLILAQTLGRKLVRARAWLRDGTLHVAWRGTGAARDSEDQSASEIGAGAAARRVRV